MQKQTLRILIASDQYPPAQGGTEKTTENLALRLSELGHQVAVIAPGRSLFKTYETTENRIPTLRVRSFPFPIIDKQRFSWSPSSQITGFVDAFQPDVVQISTPYGLASALTKYCSRNHTPLVGVSHMMPESFTFIFGRSFVATFLNERYWRWIAGRYRGCALVISPSRTAATELERAAPSLPTAVVSNGVFIPDRKELYPPDKAWQDSRRLRSVPRLIYIGRISVEKRLKDLIKAAAVAKQSVDFQLVIVGSGKYFTRMKKMVNKYRLANDTIVTGWIEKPETKYAYLRASDVFVITSPMESQSIVTLEALAYGKPVIAADACALPELVRPDYNGELFKTADYQELAQKMVTVLRNPKLRQKYGTHSRKLAMRHDIDQMPRNYIRLYTELIKAERP